ncbi:MAG TPA: sulfite exporter TauE/SafE family protein [Chitinophagaceae bacterium]|nr:sulfite exporter TauE/SafE family protein [Chitinophagaceae bacterium]
MDYVIICLVALAGSGLTLFSGFGLGTLLLPVFAIFFPVEVAIMLTAIVHFLNNLFKLGLFWENIDRGVLLRFGLTSILGAFIGALFLNWVSDMPELAAYEFAGKEFTITLVKFIIGFLLVIFALFEIRPQLSDWNVSKKYLPFGGLLSGFFGGLSGHQGALRSAFLIRSGLSKEGFIASGVAIACLVDITRLSLYAREFTKLKGEINFSLLAAATLSAFAGAYAGNRLVKKITIRSLQLIVAIMLILFAVLLAFGII